MHEHEVCVFVCMHVSYICTYTHKRIHVCIHPHRLHTNLHTYIRAAEKACLYPYMNTNKQTHTHTYTHTLGQLQSSGGRLFCYISTRIHASMYAYTNTYIHTYCRATVECRRRVVSLLQMWHASLKMYPKLLQKEA
jgi:hypothetical protein